MDIEEEVVEEIMRRVRSVVAEPYRVILFGRGATDGTVTGEPGQQLYLLILHARSRVTLSAAGRMRDALEGMSPPVQVMEMACDTFEEERDVAGGLAYTADRYGKVIFEAA